MLKTVLVPVMLVASASMMAFAWIGHLRFKEKWTFLTALGISWMIVLPEYILNVSGTRFGQGVYTGAQMASIHLCAGVLFVALVSRFYLGEPMAGRQVFGFALMALSLFLVLGD